MKRTTLVLVSIALLAVGCDRLTLPTPPQPAPAPPVASAPQGTMPDVLPPDVIDAKDATGVWNQSQVEQYLKENLKLVSLQLRSEGGADYSGSGATAEGVNYDLDVRQVPGGIRCEFTTDDGGRGGIAFGNPVP